MFATYNNRRSSVVINPRRRVFGGLGDDGSGDAPEAPDAPDAPGGIAPGGIAPGDAADNGFAFASVEAETAYAVEEAAQFANVVQSAEDAAAEAAYAAKEAAQFANAVQSAEAQADALAAAEEAVYAEQEAAKFANAVVSSKAASAAALAEMTQKAAVASSVVQAVASKLGPIGFVAAMVEKVTGFFGGLFAGAATKSGYTNAQQAINNAYAEAGSDQQLRAEITKVQQSLIAVKNAGNEAAIQQLYLTYAKRQPDPASLAYWSNRIGPTVTPNEVLQFQETLYASEPNLRPAVVTRIEPAADVGLALPLIAALAAYFILGS